jgi:branched-chain amino acid transport system substrate-binding protein
LLRHYDKREKEIVTMKNSKLLRTLLLFLAVTLMLSACGKPTGENTDKPIKIAVNCPLTGNSAEYGISFQRCIDLACKNWNSKGGVLNRKIELVYGDSKADANEAATLAQKVTSDPEIFAQIGDFNSACCMAAQPIYDAAEMIQISPTCSHVNFAPASKWSFECLGTQDVQGKFMAQWTYDMGYKNVAILYLNSDWGVSVRDGYAKAFEALGGKIITTEAYFDGETDFSAVLTKIRDTNPEALYLASYYNDGSAISIQRERLGWDIPVFCAGTVYSPKFIELGGEAVEGILTNVGFFPDDPTPEAKEFIDAYKAEYGSTPDYYGACAYDAFNILMEAIERAGKLDSNAVRDEVAKTANFPGVSGEITFDEHGDATKKYIKLTIENGEFKVVR